MPSSHMTEQMDLFHQQSSDNFVTAAIVDVETTGFSAERDAVIELAVLVFAFNPATGRVEKVEETLSWLQDPGFPLSKDTTDLTGLTDTDVQGEFIDWRRVDEVFSRCDLIIAHNAPFDRPFIETGSKVAKTKPWACSVSQIQWRDKGFESASLPKLCREFSIETRSHRAGADVEAVLEVLRHEDFTINKPYMAELFETASQPAVKVEAVGAPFEVKDLLKEHRYRWNPNERVWWRIVPQSRWSEEKAWLEKEIYKGSFAGTETVIQPVDRFKGGKGS